jgi:hypothetical protein
MAPYYGMRKPRGQYKWFLRSVYDIEVQAVGMALEAACLLHWAKSYFGPMPLVLTGMSLGGAMAGLASRLFPFEVAVVPYMGCNGPGYSYAYGMHPWRNIAHIWRSTLAKHSTQRLQKHVGASQNRTCPPSALPSLCSKCCLSLQCTHALNNVVRLLFCRCVEFLGGMERPEKQGKALYCRHGETQALQRHLTRALQEICGLPHGRG